MFFISNYPLEKLSGKVLEKPCKHAGQSVYSPESSFLIDILSLQGARSTIGRLQCPKVHCFLSGAGEIGRIIHLVLYDNFAQQWCDRLLALLASYIIE